MRITFLQGEIVDRNLCVLPPKEANADIYGT